MVVGFNVETSSPFKQQPLEHRVNGLINHCLPSLLEMYDSEDNK